MYKWFDHSGKKVRYFNQNRKTNCGPTTLMNALTWAGHQTYRKEQPYYHKITKCNVGRIGTSIDNILNAIVKNKYIKAYRNAIYSRVYIGGIDWAIANNKAVILSFAWRHKKITRHYITIIGKRKDKFIVVDYKNKPVMLLSRKRLIKYLSNINKFDNPSEAIFVSPRR